MKRRIGIVALTLAVGLVGTAAAQNTGFPAKPIRIIVTTPAGSGAERCV